MNECTKKVFEMLGLKPDEEFYGVLDNGKKYRYKLDKSLTLRIENSAHYWQVCEFFDVKHLLIGSLKIEKILKLSEKEKLILNYAYQVRGLNYLTRSRDGILHGSENEPSKTDIGGWHTITAGISVNNDFIELTNDPDCFAWITKNMNEPVSIKELLKDLEV